MARPRSLAVPLALLAALLAAPAGAQAKLRSPHLQSSCPQGYAYEEVTIAVWRIEGCGKVATPQSQESSRRVYTGTVEVNGMLIKGSRNLIATTGPSLQTITGRLQREDGRLVLDPVIGGTRREFTIFSGDVDLSSRTDNPAVANVPDIQAHPATASTPVDEIDIPVGADASILGLRLRHDVKGAALKLGTSTSGSGIEFGAKMSLGATASALLRDWTAKVQFETVDGTGLKVTGLRFNVPDIEILGTGGFHDLDVTYSSSRDEWSGGVKVDFGDLFPSIDFDMAVSASTGAPTSIAAEVSNLNIPLGPTGIALDAVRGSFVTDPLTFGAGVDVSAGPSIAGNALVKIGGDLEIRLEPSFRMNATGTARVLPVAGGELARGDMHVILDADGYLSIGGDARYELTFLDLGVSADIGGSGAYATTRNRFNIEAHASGNLELGFLGSFPVVRFGAVVSSNGWGTCGTLNFLLTAGIGQEWDRNPKLLLGCDLSEFSAPVSSARAAQNGVRERTFSVAQGTRKLAIELTADQPELPVRLVAPDGSTRAATIPLGARRVDADTEVIARPGKSVQVIVLRNPPAGTWKLQWLATGPQLTGVRIARDVEDVSATVAVERRAGDRPGRRRLRLRSLKGLLASEKVVLAVRTPAGLVPLGDPTATGGEVTFDDLGTGKRQIVAVVLRDGIPNPLRSRVIGSYTATQPPGPGAIEATRRGSRLAVRALARKGAELPDRWQYVVRSGKDRLLVRRARPGRRVRIVLPAGTGTVIVTARPIVGGRVLRGKVTSRIVRG